MSRMTVGGLFGIVLLLAACGDDSASTSATATGGATDASVHQEATTTSTEAATTTSTASPTSTTAPGAEAGLEELDADSWQASSHATLALRQLEAAREQFEASGPSSYTLTYDRACYPGCSPGLTFEVSVTDGTIASSAIVGGELPEGSTIEALSIEGLFDLAEQGIGPSPGSLSHYGFALSLHEDLGYPSALWLDMHRSGNDGFRVVSFVPS